MRFIVESGMSFNCTKLKNFKRMFTIKIPPGVPGAPAPRLSFYHMLRTTLLDELDDEVQKCVRLVLDTLKETGCTIMTDGWTNIRGQTLYNYHVGTEIGVAYVATDVMHGKKDASALANAWLKRVKSMDIELSDITTFVLDSAGVNVAAMEVFQKDENVKHIFWIPCVAHIMDLILEDIGGIDWVASRISQARLVTWFFKPHGHAREVLEAYSKKTLQLPAETRFGTNVIMMTRLVELWAELTQVVGDDRWRETVWSTSKIHKDAAKAVEDEAVMDQQLVIGTGALAKVTEEDLSLARERMLAVSRMGAERRVAESDTRQRRAGGRGRGGRGRAGVGGRTHGDVGSAPRTRRQRTDGCIRRACMHWDEGDFLFDITSRDDDDFFASGTHAATVVDRGDADDRGDYRGDGDARGDSAGPGGGDQGGDGRGGEGGGDGGGSGCRGDRVEERVDGDVLPGGRIVLQRLRRGGRQDESITSRVRRRRVHIATDTGACIMRQDPVAVSEDKLGDPSNETRRDPVHVEAQASVTDAMVTEEDTGFRITHPRSLAPVVGTEEETEFGGPGPLRQAQTWCTPARAPVHSAGAGLEDGKAQREPPPHTSNGGVEDGEVAPTPTCGQDGEDERPPTGHHVGLDCPPDSLPYTDELLTMDFALAFLPDVSLLISPTLAVVAPPEPAG
ncbi:hypothetical protein CBR_g6513 [Chara braunii]|uniref:DUF659 domain-containing protein n=1 Tax=Chara braunii TaxID=69332 RepID=A0A388KJZ7_CHABU|nr:hypothetical protein CBR_g6513 [Chara braunii]|eukprot:GBG70385.1 hypothetical protein CBR_g6513 [Chara braunii]